MTKDAASRFAVAMGQRIKLQRKLLGFSQEELASRMCYKGKGSISRIESGETEISTAQLPRLAAALETSVAYLMGWEDQAEPADPALPADEAELLLYYRKMNAHGKLSARLSVKGLSEQDFFKAE